MMNGLLLKLLALYLGSRPLYAAPTLMTRGPGAEAAALGRTAVSVVQDPTALYWNPAGLTGAGGAVTGEHLFLYDGARYDFVGLSVPSKLGSFGFGALQLHRGGIIARSAIDDPGTPVSASQADYMAGFARDFGKRWSAGATLNILDFNLAGYRDRGAGLDLGGRFSSPGEDAWLLRRPQWSFGAVLKNLFRPALKLDKEEESYPRDLNAGINVAFDGFSRLSFDSGTIRKDRALVGLGLRKVMGETEVRISLGAAYTLQDALTLRLGLEDGFAMGLGLKTSDAQFSLDYAVENRPLSMNHRFTLTYRFIKPRTAGAMPETILPDEEYARAKGRAEALGGEAFARGQELFKAQRYEEAVGSLSLAALLKPNDREAGDLYRRAVEVERRESRKNLRERLDQQVTSGDTAGAYRSLAYLLRVEPDERQRLMELSRRLVERLEPDVQERLSNELFTAATEDIRLAANHGLYAQAMAEAAWLETVVSSGSATAASKLFASLAEQSEEYRRRLENEISRGRKSGDLKRVVLAAFDLKRSWPDESRVAQAIESARRDYAATLRLSSKDRLHLRKLYYLAAVAWAKKDVSRARELLDEIRSRDAADMDAANLMDALALLGAGKERNENGGGE